MAEMQQLLFPDQDCGFGPSKSKVVNVASVPQRSPFRYAGGKTWLIPTIRKWLRGNTFPLVEPFLGGGSVSLAAVMENLAPNSIMTELDDEVSAVWETILSDDCDWLINKIRGFDLTRENVIALLNEPKVDRKTVAFRTIVKNRVFHGGILAAGAGMTKNGESGKGIGSRWYPETICKRIRNIRVCRERFEFHKADAFDCIRKYKNNPAICTFIDPPYTIAGRRLYNLHTINHEELFQLVAEIKGHYMMTYDNCPEVRVLAEKYALPYRTIAMTTTHLTQKEELIISNQLERMSD